MASHSASFTIEQVVPTDAPALAAIAGASMSTDQHTLLKAAHPTKPYHHAQGMLGAFEYWGSLPENRVDFVKAVDNNNDGQILGFVCWACRLEVTQPSAEQRPKEDSSEASQLESTTGPPLDPLGRLEEFTSQHLSDYQSRIMPPGVRAMYIMTIAVDPEHQGRGVGAALIKHGTDRADSQGVICWVHASEAGVAPLRKCGFEVDETLEIDLDEPARKMGIQPPAGQDQWGKYTVTYMVRQPKGT